MISHWDLTKTFYANFNKSSNYLNNTQKNMRPNSKRLKVRLRDCPNKWAATPRRNHNKFKWTNSFKTMNNRSDLESEVNSQNEMIYFISKLLQSDFIKIIYWI